MPRNKPKIKRNTQGNEVRVSKNAQFTVRQKGDGTKVIGGLAVVWAPSVSEDLGGFVEAIDSHAFDAHLATSPDVRALFNHDSNQMPLGRTAAGTLRLKKTSKGLSYEVDAPDTQLARDLIVSMQRGDINQSSFGFLCSKDRWEERADGSILRTVLEAQIFDVSPVTYPAYPDATSSVLRSKVNTTTAPASLRSKLKRNDDDDLDDDGDDDECDCDCSACEDGRCEDCTDNECDSENCLGCTNQERAAHIDLILRRFRS